MTRAATYRRHPGTGQIPYMPITTDGKTPAAAFTGRWLADSSVGRLWARHGPQRPTDEGGTVRAAERKREE
jgi:hypothetical protein